MVSLLLLLATGAGIVLVWRFRFPELEEKFEMVCISQVEYIFTPVHTHTHTHTH